MSITDYRLILTDANKNEIAEIDTYESFKAKPKFNQAGPWVLKLDSAMPKVSLLGMASGIILRRNGSDIFSGTTFKYQESWKNKNEKITLAGFSDIALFAERLVLPEYNTAAPGPYNSTEFFTSSGPGSTVLRDIIDKQAGPGARTSRDLGITLPIDPVTGTTISVAIRWEVLLTSLQQIALSGGDLGFDLINQVLSIYAPEDKTSTIVFSKNLGNLKSYTYTISRPKSNYQFVGDQVGGTAKTTVEVQDGQSIIDFGMIEGEFQTENTSTVSELTEAGQATLLEKAGPTSVSLEPTENSGIKYQTDYKLGDKIVARVGSVDIEQIIREVDINIKNDQVIVKPIIGTPNSTLNPALARMIYQDRVSTRQRLAKIEGR